MKKLLLVVLSIVLASNLWAAQNDYYIPISGAEGGAYCLELASGAYKVFFSNEVSRYLVFLNLVCSAYRDEFKKSGNDPLEMLLWLALIEEKESAVAWLLEMLQFVEKLHGVELKNAVVCLKKSVEEGERCLLRQAGEALAGGVAGRVAASARGKYVEMHNFVNHNRRRVVIHEYKKNKKLINDALKSGELNKGESVLKKQALSLQKDSELKSIPTTDSFLDTWAERYDKPLTEKEFSRYQSDNLKTQKSLMATGKKEMFIAGVATVAAAGLLADVAYTSYRSYQKNKAWKKFKDSKEKPYRAELARELNTFIENIIKNIPKLNEVNTLVKQFYIQISDKRWHTSLHWLINGLSEKDGKKAETFNCILGRLKEEEILFDENTKNQKMCGLTQSSAWAFWRREPSLTVYQRPSTQALILMAIMRGKISVLNNN